MFDFDLTLAGSGWAEAILREGDKVYSFDASWLHDALREFLENVNLLFTKETSGSCWQQEPGELCWTFKRRGDELTVKAEFPIEYQDDRDYDWKQHEFVGTTSFKRFVAQVESAFIQILQVWGDEGYASPKGWDYPFPHAELAELTRLKATL